MKSGQRFTAGVITLAIGPVIVSNFWPGTVGLLLLIIVVLIAMAMLGSLILSLNFDVTKWRDGGFAAGIALGVVAGGLIQLIFGPGIWRRLDLPAIVNNAAGGGHESGGLATLMWPAVWNAGVLLIGMLILALPIFAIGKLASSPGRPVAPPPRAADDPPATG
jgi:hypothetical protein